jgi:hypothetical protein
MDASCGSVTFCQVPSAKSGREAPGAFWGVNLQPVVRGKGFAVAETAARSAMTDPIGRIKAVIKGVRRKVATRRVIV